MLLFRYSSILLLSLLYLPFILALETPTTAATTTAATYETYEVGSVDPSKPIRPLKKYDPTTFKRLYPSANFISQYRFMDLQASYCGWKPKRIDLISMIAVDLVIAFIFAILILFGCRGHSHLRNYRKRKEDKEIAKEYGGHGDKTIMEGGNNQSNYTTVNTTTMA